MLKDEINSFVEMKQAMGFKFRVQDTLLQHFARFAEQNGETIVRTKSVI